ncbi:MAG: SIS domain-containing protein [Chloroflexota bacterium]
MARRAANEPLPGAPDPWAASEPPAFRGRPPYLMSEMIAAEPALAGRLMLRLAEDDAVEQLVRAIHEAASAGRPMQATGCGTSEHAAMGIAVMLSEALGLPAGHEVRSIPALEALSRPLADGLLIGVSHEGGTETTNAALRAAQDAGARTALITVSGDSPGAEIADLVVRTEEQDQSWCHTVGYLSPLLVGVTLAARLARAGIDALAIRALLDVANDPHAAAATASELAGSDRLIVAAAGADFISARELALKVAEGARMPAMALELETVMHGHLAAATRWTGLVLLLTQPEQPDGPIRQRGTRLLAAASALKVPAAAILSAEIATSIAAEGTPAGRIVLPKVGRIKGVAGSLLGSALALQLLTERLARARGVNPDTLGREDRAQAAAHEEPARSASLP